MPLFIQFSAHLSVLVCNFRFVIEVSLKSSVGVFVDDIFICIYLQAGGEQLVLQLAPTIYHECKAIFLLMERYNWTEFSLVTTKEIGK